jgi:hypothetical protein
VCQQPWAWREQRREVHETRGVTRHPTHTPGKYRGFHLGGKWARRDLDRVMLSYGETDACGGMHSPQPGKRVDIGVPEPDAALFTCLRAHLARSTPRSSPSPAAYTPALLPRHSRRSHCDLDRFGWLSSRMPTNGCCGVKSRDNLCGYTLRWAYTVRENAQMGSSSTACRCPSASCGRGHVTRYGGGLYQFAIAEWKRANSEKVAARSVVLA